MYFSKRSFLLLLSINFIFLTKEFKTIHGQSMFQKDYTNFWNLMHLNYAYSEIQGLDLDKIQAYYKPAIDTVKSVPGFIETMEIVFHEFKNGNSCLFDYNINSNRLYHSGTDIYVVIKDGKFFIEDYRKESGADLVGLKPGMEIIALNHKPIEPQLERFTSKAGKIDQESINYALRMLFAGTRNSERILSVRLPDSSIQILNPDAFSSQKNENLLIVKQLKPDVNYVKINNSLGNMKIIDAFDRVIDSLKDSKFLVLDLTETPSGKNLTVARGIMGRFTDRRMHYEIHELTEQPSGIKKNWVEFVMPRKTPFQGRLIVLVGRWTGNIGECLAFGLSGFKNTMLIGTEPSGLFGTPTTFKLNETGISFQIPTERIYHIGGMRREKVKPSYLTTNIDETWKMVNRLLKIK